MEEKMGNAVLIFETILKTSLDGASLDGASLAFWMQRLEIFHFIRSMQSLIVLVAKCLMKVTNQMIYNIVIFI